MLTADAPALIHDPVEMRSQGRFLVHGVVRVGRVSMTISTAAVEDRYHMLGKEIKACLTRGGGIEGRLRG